MPSKDQSFRHAPDDLKDFHNRTPSEVAQFLEKAGIGDYAEVFTYHKISGRLAPLLTDHDMKEMGINIVGDRLRIKALLLDLNRKIRYDARTKVVWEGEERLYFSCVDQICATCCGLFPDDPSTYRLTSNHLRIKQVTPARCGPCQLCCWRAYTINNIDLTHVNDIDVIGQPAPGLRRIFCCAPGKDLIKLSTSSEADTFIVLVEGEGDKVSNLILQQIEEAQIMERD